MDKAIIKQARQANIAEYLISVGIPLTRNGKRYKHKIHDSLVFTENAYYWNSRQEHGNAIDFLVKHMNMSFIDAVSALTNAPTIQPEKTSKRFILNHSELYHNQDQVSKYLTNKRHIGYGIIYYLIENRLLFQEKQTNNAIFSIYDENGNCVGAELQGILKTRFKGVKAGSKYGYGFNVRFSEDNTFDYALFFESALDLISFIDYKRNLEKKSLDKCILISMAGLKENIVKHSLQAFKGNMKAVLCVDNDSAGQAFISKIKTEKIPYIERLPDKKYKDWNEQLIDTKKESKVISRLYKQYELNKKGFFKKKSMLRECKNVKAFT